jgi:hypothetical protein
MSSYCEERIEGARSSEYSYTIYRIVLSSHGATCCGHEVRMESSPIDSNAVPKKA